MKRFLTLVLMALVVLYALTGCGCDDGRDVDLVFVNDSDAVIMAVLADFADQSSGVQNADSSPLKRGETFGFETGEYPVTVAVYDKTNESLSGPPLARLTINRAPPEGERWYVVARGGGGSLVLSAELSGPTVSTAWQTWARRLCGEQPAAQDRLPKALKNRRSAPASRRGLFLTKC